MVRKKVILALVLVLFSCVSTPKKPEPAESLLECSAEIKDDGFVHCGDPMSNSNLRVCHKPEKPLFHCSVPK